MSEITTQPQVGSEILVDAQPQAEPVKEPATPAVTETEQQPTERTNPFELEVKYNKESRKLSKDEAVEFAQKGMNYDKLQTRLEEIKSELETLKKPLETVGQKLGKKPTEVSELFAKQWQAAEDAKLAKAQNKPVQDVTAIREAQERAEAAEAKAREIETAEQTRQRHIQEATDFTSKYPELEIEKLPDEVKNDWLNNGKPLLEAYRVYSYAGKEAEIQQLKERIEQMEQQQKAAEINAKNAETAPEKLGSAATAEKPLTMEDIANMTEAEIRKRLPEVWAVYEKQK